jgi:hypothetical protein
MFRTYITLSKAGHYTVTIHNEQRHAIYTKRLINNIETARRIAAEFIATANQQETTT